MAPGILDAGVTYSLLFVSLYFEVFLLVSFLRRRLSPLPARAVAGALPTVAIIVPCFNEERGIAQTLQSLVALEYPREKLQILVVDDGSTDGTLVLARGFEYDSRVRVFHKENGGKHTAMNYALARTDAELIGCLDADSVAAPHALMRSAEVFADPRVAAVTPGIHTKEPKTLLQHMQKVEYRLSVFNRFMLAALGSAFIAPGPFSIFRASVVRSLGGWRHGHSTEDMEMALRIQEAGHLIANAPNATIHTATPPTLAKLFRQRVRWTYGFLRNAMDYRHMLGAKRYGHLGLIILPAALISVGTGIYFFARIFIATMRALADEYMNIVLTGSLPHVHWSAFYLNTSAMWFLVYVSIALIVVLISAGSWIGTSSRKPPLSTPLFLMLYSFLVPLWLGAAVVRAVFKTGVEWR